MPIQGGSQAKSWQSTLEYVSNINFPEDQIIYFLEDDYLHRESWNKILLEGFDLNVDYISLYDHLDKYKLPLYQKLQSKILISKSCHWRTVPSTTLSFAVKFKTFKKHFDIYKKFNFIDSGKTKDLFKKKVTFSSPIFLNSLCIVSTFVSNLFLE